MKKLRPINKFISVLFISIAASLVSCTDETCQFEGDVSDIQMGVSVNRLERGLEEIKDSLSAEQYLQQYPNYKKFLSPIAFPKAFVLFAADKRFAAVRKEISNAFNDTILASLTTELRSLFTNINYYYPEFRGYEVNTVFTGYGFDYELTNNTIYIDLAYFLNEKPQIENFPSYISRHYTMNNIVPKIAHECAKRLQAYDPSDRTLLNSMIAFGRDYYFMSKVMPCISDTILLEYTSEEFTLLQKHRKEIWNYYVKEQLFYDESPEIATRFLNPTPFTNVIADKCPGRTAQWLGYEIVKSYMEKNKDVTIVELMSNRDSKEIFAASGYRKVIGAN